MSISGSQYKSTQNISNVNKTQVQYDGLNTRVTQNEIDIAENTSDITTLSGLISANTSAIAVHELRLDGQDGVISGLFSRIGTAETDIDNLETRMGNAESDIALTNTIALDNQGAIQTHETRLNDNDVAMDSLDSNVDLNTSNIASILQRITDIQYFAGNDSTFIHNRVTIRSSIDSATSSTPQITLWNTSTQLPNQVIYSIMSGVEQGAWNDLAREGDCLMLTRNQTGVPGSYTGGMIFTTHGGSSGFRFSYDPSIPSVFRSDVDMTSHDLTTTGNISTGTMTSTGTISSGDITSSGTISSGDITSSGTISALDISAGTINLAGTDLNTRITSIESDITPLIFTEYQRASRTMVMQEDWIVPPITLTNNQTVQGREVQWKLTGTSNGVQLTNNATADAEVSYTHPGVILLRLFHTGGSGFLSNGTLTWSSTQGIPSESFLSSRIIFKVGGRPYEGVGVNSHPDYDVRIGLSTDTGFASSVYWECVGDEGWKLYVNGVLEYTSSSYNSFMSGNWLSCQFLKISGGIRTIFEFSGVPSSSESYDFIGTLPTNFKPTISLIGTGFKTDTPDRELFLDYIDCQYSGNRI